MAVPFLKLVKDCIMSWLRVSIDFFQSEANPRTSCCIRRSSMRILSLSPLSSSGSASFTNPIKPPKYGDSTWEGNKKRILITTHSFLSYFLHKFLCSGVKKTFETLRLFRFLRCPFLYVLCNINITLN